MTRSRPRSAVLAIAATSALVMAGSAAHFFAIARYVL